MNYYHFDPIKKQYIYPEDFKKFSAFQGFYHPYTLVGILVWYSWRNSLFIRKFTRVNIQKMDKFTHAVFDFINTDYRFSINKGTVGPEQKITVISYNQQNEAYFFKFAQAELSRQNIKNEAFILNSIRHLDFVPQLINYKQTTEFDYIKTSILRGKRIKQIDSIDKIIEILLVLSKQTFYQNSIEISDLKYSFAHGDFCPWNMLIGNNEEILLFDWELANNYPLGYDLFTWIFQTPILLKPKTTIEQIYSLNISNIKLFFSNFNIQNHLPYLIAFAQIKYNNAQINNDYKLIPGYSKLLDYAKTL